MIESEPSPAPAARREALLAEATLSVSGWRGRWGTKVPIPVQAPAPQPIEPAVRDLIAVGTQIFLELVRARTRHDAPRIAVATDTRPTGPACADTVIRTIIANGATAEPLGVCPTPQLLAWTAETETLDGFICVTASHNPLEYNGLKFGLADGAVLSAELARPLIVELRRRLLDEARCSATVRAIGAVDPAALEAAFARAADNLTAAAAAYRVFALAVSFGTREDGARKDSTIPRIRRAMQSDAIGIVGELNGGARTRGIDRSLLTELGARVLFANDRPGDFAHQILPEGEGLVPAAELLSDWNRRDPAFSVAYVPDNDGDRGNLVFADRTSRPVVLEAQQVFALAVAIELAWCAERGIPPGSTAVVVNGPTSERIERIAAAFGATVFRCEVGEANVVGLAATLRAEGWHVALAGEGSNGGAILPPASVRDPLITLLSLVKLRAFRLDRHFPASWRRVSGHEEHAAPTFAEVAAMLPHFETLATDDPRAKLPVPEQPHAELKRRYEERLAQRVGEALEMVATAYGITPTWEIVNYEGLRTLPGRGNRTGDELGGLRVVFRDPEGTVRASVWMRGSGTEPIFRVLADVEGPRPELLDALVTWHRSLLVEPESPR